MASSRATLALACAAALCAACHGYTAGVASAPRRAAVTMAAKEVPAYAVDGSSSGTVSVELRQSAKPMYVVHRKVITELANRRQGTASTKTRSEVSGGGRKPYKQKGTGRARRGSTRSPLIVGGGVIHGPKPKDWSIKMNKKERRVATASAIMGVLSRAIIVDDIESQFTRAKTADMTALLKRLPLEQDSAAPPKVTLITKDRVRARARAWGARGDARCAGAARVVHACRPPSARLRALPRASVRAGAARPPCRTPVGRARSRRTSSSRGATWRTWRCSR